MKGDSVTVIKRNYQGVETYRYKGQILSQDERQVTLEAFFTLQDKPFPGITLRNGDRFIETYYTDRWYNCYEIHDREDDHLKGWYCNIGYPAQFEGPVVSYNDLGLDLLVFPDGRQLVLDEDEFNALPLSEAVRDQSRAALTILMKCFSVKVPFQ